MPKASSAEVIYIKHRDAGSARSATCGHALYVCHGRVPWTRQASEATIQRAVASAAYTKRHLSPSLSLSLSLFTSRALAFLPDIIPRAAVLVSEVRPTEHLCCQRHYEREDSRTLLSPTLMSDPLLGQQLRRDGQREGRRDIQSY